MRFLSGFVYAVFFAALFFMWVRLPREERLWLVFGYSPPSAAALLAFVVGPLSFVTTGWLLRFAGFDGTWYADPALVPTFAAILLSVFALWSWVGSRIPGSYTEGNL